MQLSPVFIDLRYFSPPFSQTLRRTGALHYSNGVTNVLLIRCNRPSNNRILHNFLHTISRIFHIYWYTCVSLLYHLQMLLNKMKSYYCIYGYYCYILYRSAIYLYHMCTPIITTNASHTETFMCLPLFLSGLAFLILRSKLVIDKPPKLKVEIWRDREY